MSKNIKGFSGPILLEKTEIDNETYRKTIEIREKRIGIVFKVIYVFAIMFTGVFLDITSKHSRGLSKLYGIECCVAAFLFVMIVSMVLYIIDEMKCMRLKATDLSSEQISNTERSYSNIFYSLYIDGAACLLFAVIHMWLPGDFVYPPKVLLTMFSVCLGALIMATAISSISNGIWKSIAQGVICFAATVAIIVFLLVAAIVVNNI